MSETAPSSFINVAGATLTIADGSNAGRTTTTDDNGQYNFTGLQRGGFTLNFSKSGYQPKGTPVDLSGDRTVNISVDPEGPRTAFSSGQHRVGSTIAHGRYFSDPADSCYWERQSGLGGSLDDIEANDFVAYNPLQYIVDILSSDVAFEADPECGNWYNTPRTGSQSTIPPGVWLVGSQIAPGIYQVNSGAGCYWERLSNFTHNLDGIIANDFSASARSQLVEIRPGDVGFNNDGDCGTWTRSFAVIGDQELTTGATAREKIIANKRAYRASNTRR